MDGIDRLIEMLEQRFGKWFADALLVIVCLGAAALGLRLFIGDLVLPTASWIWEAIRYLQGHPTRITEGDVLRLLIGIGVSVVFGFLGAGAYWLVGRRMLRNFHAKIESIKNEALASATDAQVRTEEIIQNAKLKIVEEMALYNAFINAAQQAGIEVPPALLSREDEEIEPQLPLGTEENKLP